MVCVYYALKWSNNFVAKRVSLCTKKKKIIKEPNDLFARTHREGPAGEVAGLGKPFPEAMAEMEAGSPGTACF
jgi:hypothetical protein